MVRAMCGRCLSERRVKREPPSSVSILINTVHGGCQL